MTEMDKTTARVGQCRDGSSSLPCPSGFVSLRRFTKGVSVPTRSPADAAQPELLTDRRSPRFGWVTNSVSVRDTRERVIAAARDLVYRQGVERTTLGDIAQAADVRVGNVYYYFKTKGDIVAAVVQAHVDQLDADFAGLERSHRSPRARLKALVRVVAEQRGPIAESGCPFGTLGAELAKRADGVDPLAAQLVEALLGWVKRQFHLMGRRDAADLAVELVAAYQGAAMLTHALGRAELLARHARRLERWIDTLAPPRGERPNRP